METINAQIIINKIENSDAIWLYEHFSDYFQEISSYKEFKKLLSAYNSIRGTNRLYKHLHINRQDEYIWFDTNMESGASVILNKYQEIIGMALIPIKQSHSIKFSKCSYTIPLQEDWLVHTGGANELLNHHYRYKNQRNAFDFVKVIEGFTYKGDPTECENYFSYNAPILAPANGVVEEVVDGIPDCTPGEYNTMHPEGNYIVIKHGRNEYSMIAHIKPYSFKIEKGDTLLRGQHIANVGNSGNASEPHVHFQVMNHKDIQTTQTLKIKFLNNASPVKGDIVTYTGDNILVESESQFSTFFKNISTNIKHKFKS
ncbi:M23 family metallopeptidase [Staphylococcus equorum]|uniref:lysostaphin n=2 Tax=Staphylococcus equorum TaxID=246432 RepID=A0A9X4L9G1_9STAP|nr:M23 family metallopeptidase [Staphylococcus equorum]ALM56669.1 hypothetical protein SE1039_08860 [Staphylococcus equorum]MDG0819955.1 M23 family metallopeptidase [Staphylococcus equorum]MDG0840772.1 M23 family metallopeptidase [Staphylococcus equorum]MDG0846279.1 M23 family metallopeptidase [Staphylococcus equorum]MDN5610127.1 M23 family metallopeptidase [Staphylococcus equorum]